MKYVSWFIINQLINLIRIRIFRIEGFIGFLYALRHCEGEARSNPEKQSYYQFWIVSPSARNDATIHYPAK